MVRSQVAHGVIKGIDTAEAKTMPGVLGVWTGADLNAAGYGPLKTADPGAQPRRLADEDADAPLARHRQGALRRRPGGLRRRRDRWRRPRTRPKPSMLDIDSLPAVTDAREAPQARRAAGVRRRARQHLRRLPLRRQRQGRRGLRQGRACHAPAAWSATASSSAPWSRARPSADYDAKTDRYTLQRRQPGRVRPQAPDGRPARRSSRTRCAS